MAEVKNLSTKLAIISNEIGALAKDGKNKEQGYLFIGYAQVAAKVRELQAKYGVAIIPTIESYESNEVRSKYGSIGYHYLIKLQFTVMNTDDPEDKIISDWIGESTDYGDKGINKAITSGVKYFIMRLYNISDKGEEEADDTTPEPSYSKGQAPFDKANTTKQKTFQKPAPKIDFKRVNEIKQKVKEISSIEDLENYWRELKLNASYKKIVTPYFHNRKKEIVPEDPDYAE